MSGKRQRAKEEVTQLPIWIITYSDMVTLLLTFFVLLLSLAEKQDAGLVDRGRDSFNSSLRTCGLGMLLGREESADFGYVKVKYPIEPSDENVPDQRVISAPEERTQRIYEKLLSFMEAMPSNITAKKVDFSIADIHFAHLQAKLDIKAQQFLEKFCVDFHQPRRLSTQVEAAGQPSRENTSLYVLGLSRDFKTDGQNLILSAQRAQAVKDFLRDRLPSCRIYCWGAGAGGDWTGPDSPISEDCHIMIGILTGD